MKGRRLIGSLNPGSMAVREWSATVYYLSCLFIVLLRSHEMISCKEQKHAVCLKLYFIFLFRVFMKAEADRKSI